MKTTLHKKTTVGSIYADGFKPVFLAIAVAAAILSMLGSAHKSDAFTEQYMRSAAELIAELERATGKLDEAEISFRKITSSGATADALIERLKHVAPKIVCADAEASCLAAHAMLITLETTPEGFDTYNDFGRQDHVTSMYMLRSVSEEAERRLWGAIPDTLKRIRELDERTK
jgi:hypothetical protein